MGMSACQAFDMRLAVFAPAGVLLALLVGSQLLVPGIAERKAADRLTAGGGEAHVTVSAFPALRLLFEDGSRFEVDARDLELDLEEGARDLDRLDGFDHVAISIASSSAGPFTLDSLTLSRSGAQPYRLRMRGDASPAQVVDFGADRLGIPGGAIIGDLAGQALGRAPVPFALDMELESNDGRIAVVSGNGTVAGVPTGPVAEMIIAAIVARL
jgi:hypothetical protein